jgi:hypothetical protein
MAATSVELRTQHLLLAASVCLSTLQAQAQPTGDASSTLTRDELRVCMNHEDRLKRESEALRKELTRSNDDAAAIFNESATLARQQVAGFKDKPARDLYLKRSAALQQRVSAHQAGFARHRLAYADHQSAQAKYLSLCGARSFYVEDRDVVLAERAAAARQPEASKPAASAAASN